MPRLGLGSRLGSRDYGNSIEVDRRGSFTFLFSASSMLFSASSMQEAAGRAAEAGAAVRGV